MHRSGQSMLLLTSMISAWCEFCMAKLPQTQPRSYADDLSICNFAFISQELVTRTQQSHTHTTEFVQHTGMQLNAHRCVAESLPQITAHTSQFRLVGARVKLDSKKGWTDLEKERRTRWQQTVKNVGLLPSGWFTEVKIIQSTMSQLTYGQGTHSSHCNKDDKRTLRASVIRCLLNQNFMIHRLASSLPFFHPHLSILVTLLIWRLSCSSSICILHQPLAKPCVGRSPHIVKSQALTVPLTVFNNSVTILYFTRPCMTFLNNTLDEHK